MSGKKQSCLTCDGKHHAGDLVADGIAGNTLVASGISSAHILHLQIPIGTDVELATLCHLYAILGRRGSGKEGKGQNLTCGGGYQIDKEPQRWEALFLTSELYNLYECY